MVLWKKGKEIAAHKQVLLKRLEEKDKSFGGFARLGLAREYVALSAMLEWDSPLSEHDRANILWDVLDRISKQSGISEDNIIRELNKSEQRYLRNGLREFVVFTFISIDQELTVPRRKLGDTAITISPDPPSKFLQGFEEILKCAALSDLLRIPSNYQSVRIRVNAPTHTTAFHRAGEGLDLLRAFWNYSLNRGAGGRWTMGGERKPVNRIVTLPIFSIHTTSGKLATNKMWWLYPSRASSPLSSYNDAENFQKLPQEEQQIRRMLNKLPYREDLEMAFLRYVKALDLTDWTSSFFHLWNLLEFLTGVQPGDSHEKAVERCAFWFRPDDFNKLNSLILDALRRYRNRYVHSSDFTTETEAIMYTAKFYVEHMLLFQLRNNFRFQSIQDSTVVLDLPSELSGLKRSVSDMQRQERQLSRKIRLAEEVIQKLEPHEGGS